MDSKRKFLSFRDMTRQDYGKAAITGLLGGYIVSIATNMTLLHALGGLISLLGLICGLVWLYRLLLRKS